MLDIAQSVSIQVSRIFKLQEKEIIFCEAQSNEDQAQPIENRRRIISIEFYIMPKPTKTLRISVQHS